MINNYELLILNYIFNALHDFNSHHSINTGALGLINLKRNRKVPSPSAAEALMGLHGEGLYPGMRVGMVPPAPGGGWEYSKPGVICRVGNSKVSESLLLLYFGGNP